MTAFLFLGGLAFIIAFVSTASQAPTRHRFGAVLVVGVILAAVWFAIMVVTASTNPNHADCSDCDYIWGRWWWPPLVISVLGLNLVGWLLGATAGVLIRRAVAHLTEPGGPPATENSAPRNA
jgi:hypothetical protein